MWLVARGVCVGDCCYVWRADCFCVATVHAATHQAYRELLGLNATVCGDPVRALTARDVIDGCDASAVGVVIVELPQRENGGRTMSWDDLVQLRRFTTKHNIALHLDGARLWEVQPFYGRPYSEICALFDTVYVSFYKVCIVCGPTCVLLPPLPRPRRDACVKG